MADGRGEIRLVQCWDPASANVSLFLWQVDWAQVAEELDITNGHAARMRFSRFKQQIEGGSIGGGSGGVGGGRRPREALDRPKNGNKKMKKKRSAKKRAKLSGGESDDDSEERKPVMKKEGSGRVKREGSPAPGMDLSMGMDAKVKVEVKTEPDMDALASEGNQVVDMTMTDVPATSTLPFGFPVETIPAAAAAPNHIPVKFEYETPQAPSMEAEDQVQKSTARVQAQVQRPQRQSSPIIKLEPVDTDEIMILDTDEGNHNDEARRAALIQVEENIDPAILKSESEQQSSPVKIKEEPRVIESVELME